MQTETPINICVSGRIFDTTREILSKIPTISNAIDVSDGSLILNRSALVFEHVLSYVQDPFYPYPAEYAYELDFLGVTYDSDNLYRSDANMIKLFRESQKEIKVLKELLSSSQKDIEYLTNCCENISYVNYHKDNKCVKKGCKNSNMFNKVSCSHCKDLCIVGSCKEKSEYSNHCVLHDAKEYSMCDVKGCWRHKCPGKDTIHCFLHIKRL